MNKNRSPQARPSKSFRSRKKSAAVTARRSPRESHGGGATENRVESPTLQARLRTFLPVALIANVIVVSFLIVGAFAGILLTNSSFVALPASIAQLWLLANAAPVASSSTELAAVPLLPAMIVVALIAWRVYSAVKDKVSLADLYVLIACVLGVPLLMTFAALAMLLDAKSVLPVALPSISVALGRTVVVHALAFLVGLGPRLWRALVRRFGGPTSLFDTLVTAVRYLGGLAGLGLGAVLVSLAVHHRAVAEVFRAYSDSTAQGNVTALSVLYLPNLALFAAFVLAGVEVAVGRGSISLFGTYLVPLPPLPVLAAAPGSSWPYAWLLLLVPLGVAVAVSYRRIMSAERPLFDALLTSTWALVLTIVLTFMSGGRVGQYGYIGPVWWLAIIFVPLWLLVACLVAAGLSKVLGRGAQLPDAPDSEVEEDNRGIAETAETSVVAEGTEAPEGDDAAVEPAADEAPGNAVPLGLKRDAESSEDEH